MKHWQEDRDKAQFAEAQSKLELLASGRLLADAQLKIIETKVQMTRDDAYEEGYQVGSFHKKRHW